MEKIKSEKVCDSFDICKQLLFLMLEELEQLAWDIFLSVKKDMATKMRHDSDNDETFMYMISNEYIEFISTHSSNSTMRDTDTCSISSGWEGRFVNFGIQSSVGIG